jgi:phosphatidylserine/phosphatidylglycerophosphate/cardiolipin synthase-like enzyme
MGGMNVGDEWLKGGDPSYRVADLKNANGFRDNDVELQGPIVQDAVSEYERDVQHHTGVLPQGLKDIAAQLDASPEAYRSHPMGHGVRFVSNRPWEGQAGEDIEQLYLDMMGAVPKGETVTLSSAFFFPTQRMRDAIESAAARGVKFKLLLNSTDAVDPGFRTVAQGANWLYRVLQAACPPGALDIREWHGDPTRGVSSLHQKLALFGDKGPVLIGSSNLDVQSLKLNSEGVALIEDPAVREQVQTALDRDFATPGVVKMTPERLAQQPVLSRARQWLTSKLMGRSL